MRKGLFLIFALFPLTVLGAAANWPLMEFEADYSDKASLQRGAKVYMNYCMSCHSLRHARYERTADDLGVPHEIFLENLVFDPEVKIGDLMKNAMPAEDAKKWFGVAPPDLTLVTRARRPDWVYTYMQTFYKDPARPYGVNNKVFPDVGMPHVLWELQGLYAPVYHESKNKDGEAVQKVADFVHADNGGIKRDPLTGEEILYNEEGEPLNPCGRLVLEEEGLLSPEEYDQLAYDLVNFLTYVGEPMADDRKRLGIYVFLFLALLLVCKAFATAVTLGSGGSFGADGASRERKGAPLVRAPRASTARGAREGEKSAVRPAPHPISDPP